MTTPTGEKILGACLSTSPEGVQLPCHTLLVGPRLHWCEVVIPQELDDTEVKCEYDSETHSWRRTMKLVDAGVREVQAQSVLFTPIGEDVYRVTAENPGIWEDADVTVEEVTDTIAIFTATSRQTGASKDTSMP